MFSSPIKLPQPPTIRVDIKHIYPCFNGSKIGGAADLESISITAQLSTNVKKKYYANHR